MKYKIHELASLAGITVRALHHYDQIGLLKPAEIGSNGYRYYGDNEVALLQQIMFFTELDFPLNEVKKIITTPGYNAKKALLNQKELLIIKQNKLSKLMKTIDDTISQMNNSQVKPNKKLFDSFSDFEMNQYKEEAKERWGNTEAYKQSQERTKHWSKADYKKVSEDGAKFTQLLANAMDKPITDPEVQDLISKHHQGINIFYDCSLDMYKNLGQMYIDDPRFTAYYDKFRPGLAQFVRDAIHYYCDKQSK